VLRLEEWPYEVEQPLGPEIADHGRRTDFLATHPDLSGVRLATRPDVREERVGAPGAQDPETIVLRQQRGMRRAHRADTVVAGLVGACDGDLATGRLLEALGTLLERDGLREEYAGEVRDLVEGGFLLPVEDG
jgi:hypothetical protein